jgi:hypothetical protein
MLQGARDSLEDSTQAVWATLGLHEFVSENDNVAYETSIDNVGGQFTHPSLGARSRIFGA